MQSWCNATEKIHRKPREACKSSWSPIGNLKSFTLTIPWNSAKLVKIFSWNHCTSTPHRSETHGTAERAVSRVKEGALQSGLDENWWAASMECYTFCETFKISYLMGKLHTKDVLENLSQDQSFRLVHWLSVTLSLRRISQESINLERKSYLDCSSDTLSTREEFGRVTYWLQTLRSWKRRTHRKFMQKDSMQKRLYFPKKMEKIIFPVADGLIQFVGEEIRN